MSTGSAPPSSSELVAPLRPHGLRRSILPGSSVERDIGVEFDLDRLTVCRRESLFRFDRIRWRAIGSSGRTSVLDSFDGSRSTRPAVSSICSPITTSTVGSVSPAEMPPPLPKSVAAVSMAAAPSSPSSAAVAAGGGADAPVPNASSGSVPASISEVLHERSGAELPTQHASSGATPRLPIAPSSVDIARR